MIKFHKYSVEEVEFLKQNVTGRTLKDLCSMFNKKFELNVSEHSIENAKARYGLRSGISGGQFKKGNIPANKGKKWSEYMSEEGQKNSLKTTFKKGNIPENHREVGSERITKDGYIEIKVAEPNKWKLKHRLIYENNFGPIPKNHILIFADGNRTNIELDNLILVSRSEELIMNQKKLIFDNGTLTKTGVLLSKVVDTANKRKKSFKRNDI